MELRTYQSDLIANVNEAFKTHRDVMAVLPTGGGKTIVGTKIAESFGKVMWAAHRTELLDQADAKLRENHKNYRLRSIWTPPTDEYFDLLVLDETHHAPAPTIDAFIMKANFGKILGLTATPFRLDRRFLGFGEIVEGAKFDDLVAAGFLVPLDLYSVRHVNRYDGIIQWLLNNREKAPGTIIFTPNVADTEVFIRKLSSTYSMSVVHGNQPADERMNTLSHFTDGKIDILTSCMVLTEGVDLPRVQTICLARQTDSISLLMQMIGRGVRPFEGKQVCNVVEAISPLDKRQSISNIISPKCHYVVGANGKTERL